MESINATFEGASVLVTGITGFVGKVLLEKLLRCCSGVEQIYVLIRPKHLKSAETRLLELLELQCFDLIRKKSPDFARKITPVIGDITQPYFGFSEDNLDHIRRNVSIVFHCAATVKFQEPLNDAIEQNVTPVRNMLEICRSMTNLKALVHLSTAYAHCYLSHIEEKLYPLPNDLDIITSAREYSDSLCDDVLKVFPNTYTYTKALAENLIQRFKQTESSDMPIAIVRPSIISSTWKEPFPSWCDSLNGPVGLIIAFGKGFMRTMFGNNDALTNFVPVDVTVNCAIAAAWALAKDKPTEIMVYNNAVPQTNSLSWGEFAQHLKHCAKSYPLENSYRTPAYGNELCNNQQLYQVNWWIKHWIPAYVLDSCLYLTGRKTLFVRAYKKLFTASDCLAYFATNSWTWDTGNVEVLCKKLTPMDQNTFFLDTNEIEWNEYMEDYHSGVKKYILKEDLSKIDEIKRNISFWNIVKRIFQKAILLIILYYFLYY